MSRWIMPLFLMVVGFAVGRMLGFVLVHGITNRHALTAARDSLRTARYERDDARDSLREARWAVGEIAGELGHNVLPPRRIGRHPDGFALPAGLLIGTGKFKPDDLGSAWCDLDSLRFAFEPPPSRAFPDSSDR